MQNDNNQLRTRGALLPFFIASLKGISQVVLIENAITGFIILLAITSASYILGIVALLSAIIGTLVAKIGGADENDINAGLFGYNSVVTGIALTLFLSGPNHWIIALGGAAVTSLFTAAMMDLMKNSKMPVLTFPFIIVTWLMLLASYRFDTFQLSPDLVPQDLSHWTLNIEGEVNLAGAILNGIEQIFFLHNTSAGILLFIAVFWAGLEVWRIRNPRKRYRHTYNLFPRRRKFAYLYGALSIQRDFDYLRCFHYL